MTIDKGSSFTKSRLAVVQDKRAETMTSVKEIQQAILALPESDYVQLRQWLSELDWDKWDRQIEADSESGKLDFLVADAEEAKRQGTLQEL